LGLAACGPQVLRPATVSPGAVAPTEPPRARAALLLPLSGTNAPLGHALLNAATLALFEQAGSQVEFLPRDTGSTPSGAQAAARAAIADGAQILVGPLTSAESAAAAVPARSAGVPMLAFTNDASQSGSGVWVLGLTPEQQVRRVAAAAAAAGAQRLALITPQGEFGRALAGALRGAASDLGLPSPVVSTYPASADFTMAAQNLLQQMGGTPPDAVLIAESGERAKRMAAAFSTAMPTDAEAPRLLGHALWGQDPALLQGEPALSGAWFAAADPQSRARFESRYREAFGQVPPRLAGAAYDAAGLAARALRVGPGMHATPATGEAFFGADGPLRLMPTGQAVRGLAIFAISPSGEPVLVDPASIPSGAGS
jgi:ABC-type branched-subunit amino acid transport system substrate-binding protein